MMVKKLVTLTMMFSAASGASAQNAGFGVTGTITPGACTLTLSGGGIADYGELSVMTVKGFPLAGTGGNSYRLPDRNVSLSVVCTNSIKVKLAIDDNLAANRKVIDADDFYRFGLTDGNGATLGAYAMNSSALTINGGQAPAGVLGAPNGTNFWLSGDADNRLADRWQNGYTFGYVTATDHYEPDAVVSIEGVLTFNVFVDRARVDSLASRMSMTGSGTVTLVYL